MRVWRLKPSGPKTLNASAAALAGGSSGVVARRLLDRQGALHARGAMLVDAAIEGVLARVEVLRERGAALGDGLAAPELVAVGTLQAHVVGHRGGVIEVDRHLPGAVRG